MLLGIIQLLRSHRWVGGGERGGGNHVNANLCTQIVLMTDLVHKLLGIFTRFFVIFIKASVLLKISGLKKLFFIYTLNCKSNKFPETIT